MAPRFMRRPKAELDLHVYGETFHPALEVSCRVMILSQAEFDVREARVSLVCRETYWVVVSDGKTTRQQKRTRVIAEVPHRFLVGGKIRAGLAYREETTLTLPGDAPLTVVGTRANLSWQLRLSIDVRGARDLHAEKAFSVVARAESSTPGRAAPPAVAEKQYNECVVRIENPARGFRSGDSLDGTLSLDAVANCEFSEVRVELIRREKAGVKKSSTVAHRITLETDARYVPTTNKRWRFALAIPDGAFPTTSISDTTVAWEVKGVFSRSFRADYSVKSEIVVL